MGWNILTGEQVDNDGFFGFSDMPHESFANFNESTADFDLSSWLGQWWHSGLQQDKEFYQQTALAEYQNAWNSAPNQMDLAIKAGINPNTAAGVVAGGQTAPTSVPSSAVGSGAQSAQALGDTVTKALGTYSNMQLQEAQKENIIAQTKEVHDNAETNRLLQAAQRFAALKAGGVDNEKAKILAIDYKYSNVEHIQDFYLKQQNIENMRVQYKTIQDDHELKLKEIASYDDRISAAISLDEAKALEARKHAAEIEENTRYQKKINDFWDEHDFDPKSPCDVSLKQQFVAAYNSGDYSAYEASLKQYGDSFYTASYGSYSAESQLAGQIAFARQSGQSVAETMYGHANNVFDLVKQLGLNAKIRLNGVPYEPNSVTDSDIQISANELENDFKNKNYNKIRKDIVDHYNHLLELQDLYISREGSPNPIYQNQIDMCRAMLQLNNQEMIDWWKRSQPSAQGNQPITK